MAQAGRMKPAKQQLSASESSLSDTARERQEDSDHCVLGREAKGQTEGQPVQPTARIQGAGAALVLGRWAAHTHLL